METTTPKFITASILSLCQKIDTMASPVYISTQPQVGCALNDCFLNVPEIIQKKGGKIQYGWQIWEWPGVYIEAEFHAVWVNGSNNFVDVTPKEQAVDKILFLPDNRRTFEGKQVNNVRLALSSDPLIKRLFLVCDRIFEVQNEGELEGTFGLVSIESEEILPLYREKESLIKEICLNHRRSLLH